MAKRKEKDSLFPAALIGFRLDALDKVGERVGVVGEGISVQAGLGTKLGSGGAGGVRGGQEGEGLDDFLTVAVAIGFGGIDGRRDGPNNGAIFLRLVLYEERVGGIILGDEFARRCVGGSSTAPVEDAIGGGSDDAGPSGSVGDGFGVFFGWLPGVVGEHK